MMATTVELALNEMTEFDLPRVCVVSGATSGVVFKDVKFQWYPRWIGAFGVAPFIMIILMATLSRRAQGKLPFTEEAWDAWQRAKLLLGLSLCGGLALMVLSSFLFSKELVAAGFICIAFAIALPVSVGITQLRGRGVTCVKIEKSSIHLKIPSDEAARHFSRHLKGGA
jgi:hypothetical protein